MGAARETVFSVLSDLAPLTLAEPWDNVGLLIDPGPVSFIESALLTVDLTDAVLSEALGLGVELIVAYHPPLFSGLKRLRAEEPDERVIVRALQGGLTVYSPHTALDAAEGGMAAWLGSALGSGKMKPIEPVLATPHVGAGRIVELDDPLDLGEACSKIKKHLGLSHLRLARAEGRAQIRSLAVCPGAGGSLFEKVGDVDLLLTGEMRHHDVLARCARGTHVILTDHTHSERGYLPVFCESLKRRVPEVIWRVSQTDRDPLSIV